MHSFHEDRESIEHPASPGPGAGPDLADTVALHMLETVVNHMPAAVALIDSDLRLRFVNRAYQSIAPKKEMLGKTLEELWPETGQAFSVICRRVLETGETHNVVDELNLIRRSPDGPLEETYFTWSLQRVRLVGEEGWALLNTAWETTARKKAEQRLREAELRYNTLFENRLTGTCYCEAILDEKGQPVDYRFLEVNRAFLELTGLSEDAVVGATATEVMPGIENSEFDFIGVHCNVALTGEEISFEQYNEVLKKWYSVFVCSPKPGYFLSVFSDITKRKQSEEELLQTTTLLQTISDSTGDVIFVKDRQGRLIFANPATLALIGKTEEEVLGRTDLEFLEDKDAARRVTDNDRRIMETGVAEDLEEEVPLPNGEKAIWLSRKVPYRNVEGEVIGLLGVSRDITERKRSQAALMRSEKLASVGRMAATIAHEINNPLQSVTNSLLLAQSVEGVPEATRHYLQTAEQELQRVAQITRQSLGFFRDTAVPAPTSISGVLDSALDLLKHKIKFKNAHIDRRYEEGPKVQAVGSELRQVFCNLLANSLDAIESGGAITLRIRQRTLSDGQSYVTVTLADNGAGLSPSAKLHLFEPLFSTKKDVGTGLGLWVSQQIIEKHGGKIKIRSKTEGRYRGTLVKVTLK